MTVHDDISFDPFAGPVLARVVPSTDAQREIWTAVQLGAEAAPSYHEAVVLRIRGAPDRPALERALALLIARHDSLRSTFSSDGLQMLIAEPGAADIAWADWSALGADVRARHIDDLLSAAVTTPYDLERGPLIRLSVATVSAQEHLLVIAAHHVVCDGWSFGVLVSQLPALYAHALSPDAPVPPAAEQFADYAVALRSPEQREEIESASAYWLQQFATLPSPLDLPTDRPRPRRKTFKASREDLRLTAELVTELRAQGVRTDNSLFVTLLGAFTALISRLAGEEDVVVGIASAGQAAAHRPGLVGHCVNTLPVRMRAASDITFSEFLRSVRTETLNVFENQALGFGTLLERLQVPRDPARTPLISVMFNLDRALRPASLAFGDCTVELQTIARVAENFELFVNMVEDDRGLALECQYNTDLFDAATIRRWLNAYEQLLWSAAQNPELPLRELFMLTKADLVALDALNATASPGTSDWLVHELIERQADATPDRVAIEQAGVAMQYAELNASANQLAHHLQRCGIGSGAMVGLYLGRTPQTVVALLGILKSGAAYVPLDPAQPLDRLKRMASDAQLAAVITDRELSQEGTLLAPLVICIDAEEERAIIASASARNLHRDQQSARANSAAYVLYTSGSTGAPKGVVVPHRALANLLRSVQQTPGLSPDDVVLAITTLSFDIAVSEILLPLTVGARIVLATRDTASDGAELRSLIESQGVTFIDATPATYAMLLEAGWTGHNKLRLISTGEALPLELARRLVRCSSELWNGYGPTETTVWSTFARVREPVDRVLIGRPILNTRVSIRDPHGAIVPVGVVGELFIGGAGVADGYLNEPALTASRFSVDAEDASLRWYRTGDLVRLLSGGELECLGRTDDQVKVRGYRVELGEIAAAIDRWDGVRQSVAAVRGTGHLQRLVAYVVADDTIPLDETFRKHLKRLLPGYMVPSSIVRLASLPLTVSGKVDRKRLPTDEPVASRTFQAPRTDTERMLAELWSAALRLPRVSVLDDFFALGGHSVLAAQVLARLRREHGIDLTFRRVFESPTIAELAQCIDTDREAGKARTVSAGIPHRKGVPSSPVSALQERLWNLEELEPARRAAHSHPACWRLTGTLNPDLLEQCLVAVIGRHDMLRTSFVVTSEGRRQTVHADIAFRLGHLDLRGQPANEQARAQSAFFEAQQFTPFDIATAPLFRATLIRLSDDVALLYTLQHGLIWDGWSFDLFLQELVTLYQSALHPSADELPDISVTYGDFATWQQEWLQGEEAEAQRSWWDAQLQGAHEALALPFDRVRAGVSAYAGGQQSIVMTVEEMSALEQLARRHDGTLYMVVLAAYAILLQRYTAQDDLLIASPMRARTRPEVESVIGPFVNMAVMRLRLQPDLSFAQVLRSVREYAIDSYSRQDLPFERLDSRLPNIRAVFSMQDARVRPTRMGDLDVHQLHVPLHLATNDLTLWIVQFTDRLTASLNFSTEVLSPHFAEHFLEHFRALLRTLTQWDANAPLNTLSLPVAESASASRVPPVVAATSALEVTWQRVQQNGSRIAVRYGSEATSYLDMWVRAKRISAALAAKGVLPEDIVGIALPPGIDRFAAMLGVLMRGADSLNLTRQDSVSFNELLQSVTQPKLVIGPAAFDGALSLSALEADIPDVPMGDEAAQSTSGGVAHFAPQVCAQSDHAFALTRLSRARIDEHARSVATSLTQLSDGTIAFALPWQSPAYLSGMLGVLAIGGTIVPFDDDGLFDGLDLAEVVEDEECTGMLGTAATWREVARSGEPRLSAISGLIVGHGLQASELRSLHRTDARRVQTFGPTDDALLTSFHELTEDQAAPKAAAPAGPARLAVLDDAAREVPEGMPGHLHWCAADALPLLPTFARARRSGDSFQMLENPDQIFLPHGGVPVAVRPLEAAFERALDGASVGLVMHRDGHERPALVAYVALGSAADVVEIRAKLRNAAPAYCQPARIIAVDVVPRAENGRPIIRLLPSPFLAEGSQRGSEHPRGANEQLLARIWQELLDISFVGRSDNFFNLGGTSLLCFRAIETMRVQGNATISPRLLLTGTLASVAELLPSAPAD